MSPAISSEKNMAMPSRKKYSASTRLAIVDARSGKRGMPDHISTGAGFWVRRARCGVLGARCWVRGAWCRRATVAPNHDQDERPDCKDGPDTGQADRAHDGHA